MVEASSELVRGPSRERLWLEIGLAFGVSLLLLYLNLFGRGAVIERYGQGMFNAVFGPGLYGAGERDNVSVVLVQDADLAELGLAWPIPYGEHARILAAIRELRPRALMIDFLFVDPRDDASLPVLVQELQAYRDAGIPVFLARPPDRVPTPDVRSSFREPLTHLVPVPHVVGRDSTYQLAVRQCEPRADGEEACRERTRPTAAPAVYAAVCSGTGPRIGCRRPLLSVSDPAGEAPSPAATGGAHGPHLEIFWGTLPERKSLVGGACQERAGRVRSTRTLSRLFAALWRGGEHLSAECPFLATISPTRLLDERSPELAARLRDLVGGRAVFYGASLLGASDVIQPPVHAPVGGVYAHAMAFDNLLTLGAGFKREETHVLGLRVTPERLQIPLLFVTQVVLLYAFRRLQGRIVERRELAGARAVAVAAVFWVGHLLAALLVVVATAVIAEFWLLDLMPSNWLEAALDVLVGRESGVFMASMLGRVLEGWLPRRA